MTGYDPSQKVGHAPHRLRFRAQSPAPRSRQARRDGHRAAASFHDLLGCDQSAAAFAGGSAPSTAPCTRRAISELSSASPATPCMAGCGARCPRSPTRCSTAVTGKDFGDTVLSLFTVRSPAIRPGEQGLAHDAGHAATPRAGCVRRGTAGLATSRRFQQRTGRPRVSTMTSPSGRWPPIAGR